MIRSLIFYSALSLLILFAVIMIILISVRQQVRTSDEQRVSAYNNKILLIQACRPEKTALLESVVVKPQDILSNPNMAQIIKQSVSPDKEGMLKYKKWVHENNPASINSSVIQISQTLIRGTVGSHGGGDGFLAGATQLHQPVYEMKGARVGETIALNVSINDGLSNDRKDRIEYWYRIPKDIKDERFTAWYEPFSEESAEVISKQRFFTFQNLLAGKEVTTYPVDNNKAPKLRFKIVNESEYEPEFMARLKGNSNNIIPELTEALPNCGSAIANAN